jgi:predicted nucleic acid-binding protein
LLLDTSVLIEIQRGHKPGREGLPKNERKPLSISWASIFECSVGAGRAPDIGQLRGFLDGVVMISADAPIGWRAGEYIRRFQRSRGVGQIDSLIAATGLIAQRPLILLNTKHVPDVPDVRRPYRA